MKRKTGSIIEQVKDAIREPFVWPGGYGKVILFSDGECTLPRNAKNNFLNIVIDTRDQRGIWEVHAVFVHWEGPDLIDTITGEEIKSEYGDPTA